MPIVNRFRELVLWVGAALGLLAIAAGLAVAIGGFSFLVFRSGSMAPEIPTGGLALSRSVAAEDLQSGDIVSVTAASGERITHRVVSTTMRGEQAVLVLKGDANDAADSEVYVVGSAERVVASVPFGGYVVAQALTPPGIVALGAASLILIILSGGDRAATSRPDVQREKPRHRARASAKRRIVALVLVVAAGCGVAGSGTYGTWAIFNDRAPASTGSFGAGVVARPSSITCDPNSATIRWTAPAAGSAGTPTGYKMYWSYNGGNGTSDFGPTTFSGRPPAPGLFGNRLYSVSIVAVYGPWESPSTASDGIRGQNLGLFWSC